jgi:hypothetical protein
MYAVRALCMSLPGKRASATVADYGAYSEEKFQLVRAAQCGTAA